MWTGLTSNISPRRNTIATQETISAWFWMINSWLITGGFLLGFFRIPMSTRFGPKVLFPCCLPRCGRRSLRYIVNVRCEDAQSSLLLLPMSSGPGSNEWRVTLLPVGGVRAPDQRHPSRTGEKELVLFIATQRFGGTVGFQEAQPLTPHLYKFVWEFIYFC